MTCFILNPYFCISMNTSANKIYSSCKANIYSAFLFALAVLLLVVSCPLKRVLQVNVTFNSSPATRTNQTNISQQTNAGFGATCAVKKKTLFVEPGLIQKVQIAIPFYFSNVANATGFDINHYLSRIHCQPAYVVSSNTSSLPIYLQHLRLLI